MSLEFTGERFLPGTRGEIWMEHWHRYHFAARLAKGRRVLDVACGEGYGTALLAPEAREVTGVDVSAESIAHAKGAYASIGNVTFVEASCASLPLASGSIDLAVSFETLEHIHEQEDFIGELARVIAPGGLLVLSCPNKREYSDRRGYANEFHVRELYRDELHALVAGHFPAIAWYGQKPGFYSVIASERGPGPARLLEVTEEDPGDGSETLAEPLYFLIAASRDPQALAAMPEALSVLADRGEWVHRDYEKVMRWMVEHAARGDRLQSELAVATARIEEHGREMEQRDREIARRHGWRWWLRLPLVRLGLLD